MHGRQEDLKPSERSEPISVERSQSFSRLVLNNMHGDHPPDRLQITSAVLHNIGYLVKEEKLETVQLRFLAWKASTKLSPSICFNLEHKSCSCSCSLSIRS